ncbi:replication/maintenance protein RepL, partial [Paenibacillus sp. FSL K6-1230]|uniref:replication/maintenance protein RepL n=1 Tax=Paenibacillus sp. FSL K6-1230 TaxID=2921603 RepID=UPI0030F66D8B
MRGGIKKLEDKKITLELTKDEFNKLQKLLEFEKNEEKKHTQKEEEKKNYNFIQLYRDHMSEMRWLMTNHQFASSILFFIIEHMDNRNALACSYSVFEDYFEKHKTTIYRNLKILEDNGFISILKM